MCARDLSSHQLYQQSHAVPIMGSTWNIIPVPLWRYGIVPMYLVIACIVYRILDGPTCVGLIGTIIVETDSSSYEANWSKHFQRRWCSERWRALSARRRRSGARTPLRGLGSALAPLHVVCDPPTGCPFQTCRDRFPCRSSNQAVPGATSAAVPGS